MVSNFGIGIVIRDIYNGNKKLATRKGTKVQVQKLVNTGGLLDKVMTFQITKVTKDDLQPGIFMSHIRDIEFDNPAITTLFGENEKY